MLLPIDSQVNVHGDPLAPLKISKIGSADVITRTAISCYPGPVNVSLTPELERLITDKLDTGMYQTASEVVREGLRLLKDRDERQLRADVRSGFDSVDRGDYNDYTASSIRTLAAKVKATGRRELAPPKKSRA
jgi:antitoxin ParD1/3/4